jgi:hypothetical protein
VEAVPVGSEPVADVRRRGVVDDRDADRLGRALLERVHGRDQVVEPVVREDDDVGGV